MESLFIFSSNVLQVAIRSLVILASGLATYHLFVSPMWSLELTSMHVGKPESTSSDSCTTPFHDVPVWQSVSAEFIGSLVLGVVPGLIVENPTLVNYFDCNCGVFINDVNFF